jgi:hypothetical protein
LRDQLIIAFHAPCASTAVPLQSRLPPWWCSPARRRQPRQYAAQQPQRHFITVSADWLYTLPLHFEKHPLEALVGSEVAIASASLRLLHARRQITVIDVLEFKRRGRGGGVTIFPFGSSTGSTLALRGSLRAAARDQDDLRR